MGSKRGNRHKSDDIELNLVPIMGLLVVLIPVLLFAFKFFEIKVQAVSAPRMSSGKAKKKSQNDKKPLNLTVIIGHDRFTVNVQEEHAAALQSRYPDWNPVILKKNFTVGGKHKAQVREGTGKIIEQEQVSGWYGKEVRKITEYDFPTLYTRLMQVKQAYPKEKTVNIGAKMDVRWQVLARTIDTARLQLVKPAYREIEEYSMAISNQQARTCEKDEDCDGAPNRCNAGSCEKKAESGMKPMLEDTPLFPGVVFVVAEN
jgi:biopolymer transport protein ExbD